MVRTVFLFLGFVFAGAYCSLAVGEGLVELREFVFSEDEWGTAIVEVGTISETTEAKWEIKFANNTNGAVKFTEVKIPCRCTKAKFTKEKILPGENSIFHVAIARNPADIGKFSHSINTKFECEAGTRNLRLKLVGDWQGPFRIVRGPVNMDTNNDVRYELALREDFDRERFTVLASDEVIESWSLDEAGETEGRLVLRGNSRVARSHFPVVLKYRTEKNASIPEFTATITPVFGSNRVVLKVFPRSISRTKTGSQERNFKVFLGGVGDNQQF